VTNAPDSTGYAIVEMASHTASYRTVLAPPPEFGIDWRRVATMLAVALCDTATSDVGCRTAVHADAGHTVFARSRPLEGAEVGVNHPVTDASSRPIVLTEGVVFAGQVTGDPETVLRAAQSQFGSVIRDFWDDAAEFVTPRFSEPVTCRVVPAEVARVYPDPTPEHGEVVVGRGMPSTAASVATPLVRPAPRRHLLTVLVALLAIAALVVIVAVILLR
jgi:hypothetical protein